MASCTICLARLRDSYRERKGETVSKDGQAQRLMRARRVIEKALKARIQGEKRKELWLEARKQWEQGDGGFRQRDIESFRKGEEYCEGPYRQWIGYTEPREENWREKNWRKESWEAYTGPQVQQRAFTGEGEAFDGPQVHWEGQESPQRGQEDSEGESEAWDGSQRGSEACDSLQREQNEPTRDSMGDNEACDGPQIEQDEPIDQYCSSCNQKKPVIDFGRFLTCNPCRQRNRKANQARWTKQKALLNKSS
jgi:hypothetical protein